MAPAPELRLPELLAGHLDSAPKIRRPTYCIEAIELASHAFLYRPGLLIETALHLLCLM